MLMRKFIISVFVLVASMAVRAQGPQVLIPVPQHYELHDGTYRFESQPKVDSKIDVSAFAGPEAYTLKVTPKKVVVRAGGEAGLFYALQSLDLMTR